MSLLSAESLLKTILNVANWFFLCGCVKNEAVFGEKYEKQAHESIT